VWGCWGVELVEELASFGSLEFGPATDWRASPNHTVLGLDLGGSATGDQGPDVFLEGSERDKVAVSLCVVVSMIVMAGGREGTNTKSLDRKSWTSGTVLGPPIFNRTIAVPFPPPAPPAGDWAGGETVARLLAATTEGGRRWLKNELGKAVIAVARVSCWMDIRPTIESRQRCVQTSSSKRTPKIRREGSRIGGVWEGL